MPKYPLSVLFSLLFINQLLSAQIKTENNTLGIPSGYYNNAYSSPGVPKTCATLKTALYGIISVGTTDVGYTPGIWNAIKTTDMHRNDANNADIIWDMYSDNPTGAEPYTFTYNTNQCGTYNGEGDCYNREHSFPQSWFNSGSPMVSDIHHIFPTDGYVNGKRSDNPYGRVTTPSWTSQNGSKLGPSSFLGYTGTVFEPRDEYKGDVARAMFYMVTRYENVVASWKNNANAGDILDGTSWPALKTWPIELWYQWHIQDPVSQKEIARNDAIYALQKNRNPYIDHPEFVGLVWQCTGLVPVTLVDFGAFNKNNAIEVDWSVANDPNVRSYEIERSTDGTHFNMAGNIAGSNTTKYSFTDTKSNTGGKIFYRLKVIYFNGKTDYSKIIDLQTDNSSSAFIFPNPAKDFLTIQFKHTSTAAGQLRMNDVFGRTVLNKSILPNSGSIKVDIHNLPVGKYILAINTGSESIHEMIVIVK